MTFETRKFRQKQFYRAQNAGNCGKIRGLCGKPSEKAALIADLSTRVFNRVWISGISTRVFYTLLKTFVKNYAKPESFHTAL